MRVGAFRCVSSFRFGVLTGNTSVGELGFAVSAKGVVVGLGGESERIPESDGFEGTDKGVDDGNRLGNGGGGGLLSERRESGGGSGKGKDGGGNEFHFGIVCWKILKTLKIVLNLIL